MTTTLTTDEIKKELDGYEIESLQFEGVVAVDKGKVIRAYDHKEMRMSAKKWHTLFDELFYQEFGTMNINDLI